MSHLVPLGIYCSVGFYEPPDLIGVYVIPLAFMSHLIPLGTYYGVGFYEPPNPIEYISCCWLLWAT